MDGQAGDGLANPVAAGNDRSESSAAHDLAEPLFGRFAHIYIRTTVENWMPWAVRNRINPYVMEFLANNDLYLRTPFTGTEGNADPRRWEMVSKALDSSGNDFSLLEPIVGRETAESFIRFFKAQQQLAALGEYTDEELVEEIAKMLSGDSITEAALAQAKHLLSR